MGDVVAGCRDDDMLDVGVCVMSLQAVETSQTTAAW